MNRDEWVIKTAVTMGIDPNKLKKAERLPGVLTYADGDTNVFLDPVSRYSFKISGTVGIHNISGEQEIARQFVKGRWHGLIDAIFDIAGPAALENPNLRKPCISDSIIYTKRKELEELAQRRVDEFHRPKED